HLDAVGRLVRLVGGLGLEGRLVILVCLGKLALVLEGHALGEQLLGVIGVLVHRLLRVAGEKPRRGVAAVGRPLLGCVTPGSDERQRADGGAQPVTIGAHGDNLSRTRTGGPAPGSVPDGAGPGARKSARRPLNTKTSVEWAPLVPARPGFSRPLLEPREG